LAAAWACVDRLRNGTLRGAGHGSGMPREYLIAFTAVSWVAAASGNWSAGAVTIAIPE
jgi:hypothetical protein